MSLEQKWAANRVKRSAMDIRTDLDTILICSVSNLGDKCTSTECDAIPSIIDFDLVQASEIDDNVFLLDIERRCPAMGASLSKKVKVLFNTVFDLD